MNIRELVLRDYARGAQIAEDMASKFAAGTPQEARWRLVAETYRQLVSPADEPEGRVALRHPAPQQVLGQS